MGTDSRFPVMSMEENSYFKGFLSKEKLVNAKVFEKSKCS